MSTTQDIQRAIDTAATQYVEVYHGTHRADVELHVGQCWADSADIAREYGDEAVASANLDLEGLSVAIVEGNRADNCWPGDATWPTDIDAGVDVLAYVDSSYSGADHITWRLMSERAIAALVDVAPVDADDE